MDKIEPLTPERIKADLPHLFDLYRKDRDTLTRITALVTLQVVLSWIHAEARARKSEAWMAWILNNKEGPSPSMAEDWIAAVKNEVGWVD